MSKKSKKLAEVSQSNYLDNYLGTNQPIQSQQQNQPVSEQTVVLRRPKIAFKVMNNCAPVPVAKPADFIQLTPIVQPIPIVPYSTQTQPIAMFEEDDEN